MNLDWKHLFNWHISSVSSPRPVMQNDWITGYMVVVNYKYHGPRKIFFGCIEEKWNTVYCGAEEAARCTYQQYLDKMNTQQKQRKRNR